jgi:hypothetical protein
MDSLILLVQFKQSLRKSEVKMIEDPATARILHRNRMGRALSANQKMTGNSFGND